jgi:hypothetical protein
MWCRFPDGWKAATSWSRKLKSSLRIYLFASATMCHCKCLQQEDRPNSKTPGEASPELTRRLEREAKSFSVVYWWLYRTQCYKLISWEGHGQERRWTNMTKATVRVAVITAGIRSQNLPKTCQKHWILSSYQWRLLSPVTKCKADTLVQAVCLTAADRSVSRCSRSGQHK